MFIKATVGFLAAACAVVAAPNSVVKKDVLVIGGGASGAHAAIRLREDFGLSVALIEKQGILGGHVNTYTDPETGDYYNYGVQTWVTTGNATGFFDRLNVPHGPPARVATESRYIDFTTGDSVDYTPPTNDEQTIALQRFLTLEEKYEQFLFPGYWNFPEADAIPEELLMPWGDFAKKHDLEGASPIIWRVGLQGLGDMSSEMTIYIMMNFPLALTRSFVGLATSVVPSSGRSQDLYDAADQLLGEDVYKSSTVVSAKRSQRGVKAVVENHENGEKTVIVARALVMGVEPVAENLDVFSLDEIEGSTFKKFIYTNVWAGIFTNKILPVGDALVNTDADAAPENWLAFPSLPFSTRIDYMGAEKYFRIMFQGTVDMDDAAAKAHVQADVDRMVESGALPAAEDTELEYITWAPHGAMHARVTREDLESGFIQDLYSLQGRHSTWWTGAAFSSGYQTSLWEYNDVMLPKLVAWLKEE